MKKSFFFFCILSAFAANAIAQNECADAFGSLASIRFSPRSNRLNDEAKEILAAVAGKLRKNPSCTLVVTGYCDDSNEAKQLSWDHVNAIVNYYFINKEGLAPERFIFKYAQKGGDCNQAGLRVAAPGETGPNWVDAPFPDLRLN